MDEQKSSGKTGKPSASGKIVTVSGFVIIAAILIFIAGSTVSMLKEQQQESKDSGYSSFEYAKDIAVSYNSSQECAIGGNTYYLMSDFRSGYVIENKGRYNNYGFFFGEAPDFHMMNYDSSSVEFWYMNVLFRYPETGRDKVVSLIIPDAATYKTFGNGSDGLVRISFGTAPIELTDTVIIENAISEYNEKRHYSCSVQGVPDGTPIYAKFENSCLYYMLGYTAGE